ncbi:MAG: murein L,D-transpeptidase catalytic domain-containing protein [Chitinophagales bacterium]|jgi:hypothetical protein|nr:murein L,D-transpeptidase catalytic domain family protein [Sphingobacteriales bacterium]
MTFFSFTILSFSLFSIACCNQPSIRKHLAELTTHEETKPTMHLDSLRVKASEAFIFCRKNQFEDKYCILIDMQLHSGVRRFVLWNFEKDTVQFACLVGHGCGNHPWSLDRSKSNPSFSNEDGSHLSSLGKYKIGARGVSDWGVKIKYALHGLESSNSNAARRHIVFHSWEAMTDEEIYPAGSAEGWGCPTISDNSFKCLDPILKESKKPVLMHCCPR